MLFIYIYIYIYMHVCACVCVCVCHVRHVIKMALTEISIRFFYVLRCVNALVRIINNKYSYVRLDTYPQVHGNKHVPIYKQQ